MRSKILFLFLFSILLIGIISAVGVSYCCEKTTAGFWCINAPKEECKTGNNCGTTANPSICRSVPTSCESTSYCRLGTCINSKEGECMPNTPERVCTVINNGVWSDKEKSSLPQCQLGCCLIGDQAAFVTQTKCKKLSSEYGLSINYRADIKNERECISSAMPQKKGACVFEKENERDCKFITKKECQEMGGNSTEFHEGYLCSAESLNTVCGARGGTTCVDGEDAVYFMDTCGNLANVYDADKLNNTLYWTYTAGTKGVSVDCSVGDITSALLNAGTCGNCDYYLGTTCKKGNAFYGNNICKDLGCTYEGKDYDHGETWCAYSKDDKATNSPGGKNFRLVCYNGEVSVEPCAEYRQEICIESAIGDFKTAGCRVNMWQDCFAQDNLQDCENEDRRDCKWVGGVESSIEKGKGIKPTKVINDYCVPNYSPGFDFWKNDSDAASLCGLANDVCTVEYYSGAAEGAVMSLITGGPITWKPSGNTECLKECKESGICGFDDPIHICDTKCAAECLKESCVNEAGDLRTDSNSWKVKKQDLCISLGDCGSKTNYLGAIGYQKNWDESFVTEKMGGNQTGKGTSIFDMIGQGALGKLFG